MIPYHLSPCTCARPLVLLVKHVLIADNKETDFSPRETHENPLQVRQEP